MHAWMHQVEYCVCDACRRGLGTSRTRARTCIHVTVQCACMGHWRTRGGAGGVQRAPHKLPERALGEDADLMTA